MPIDGVLTAGLPQATGVSLNRILWAYRTGRLPEPARLGCHRVHSPEDVQRIIAYFRGVDEQRRLARGRKAAGPRAAASGAAGGQPAADRGRVTPGEGDHARRA